MTMTTEEGKRRRRVGGEFERKVRKDLESKGWIVDKWTNNVDLVDFTIVEEEDNGDVLKHGKLHPAKSNRFNMRSTGFPDFIAFKQGIKVFEMFYEVIAVESKTTGILSKAEKEKCDWYLKNNVFSKILIGFKGDDGKVEYMEYGNKT